MAEKQNLEKTTYEIILNISTFAIQRFKKEKEEVIKDIFEEIMAKNVPNLKKETNIQEAQDPKYMNSRSTRHITIKWQALKI